MTTNEKERDQIINDLRTLIEKLTDCGWQKREIAQKIGINNDALSKSIGQNEEQKHQTYFGKKTRQEIYDTILQVPELKESFETGKKKAGIAEDVWSENDIFFVSCAQIAGDEVQYRGLFRFYNNWQQVEVKYFSNDKQILRSYDYCSFLDKPANTAVCILAESSNANPAFYCLFKMQGNWKNSPFLRGVYATTNLNNLPTCGEVILKRVANKEEAYELIGQKASDLLYYHVSQRQIKVEDRALLREEDFPHFANTKILRTLSGIYRGFFLDLSSTSIATAILNISSNGQIHFKSSAYKRVFIGKAVLLSEDYLLILLDYLDFTVPQKIVTLKIVRGTPNEQTHLEGIFSGAMLDGPFSKLILFQRLLDDSEFEELHPVSYDFLEAKNENFYPAFFDFVYKRNYPDDTMYAYMQTEISEELQIGNESNYEETSSNDLSDWEGMYECYVMAYNNNYRKCSLQKLSLYIADNGKAILRSTRRSYYGYFRLAFEEQLLIGEFENDEPGNTPKFYIILGAIHNKMNNFTGVYAGKDPFIMHPMAGKILMRKTSSESDGSQAEDFPFDTEDFHLFSKNNEDIIQFFLGFHDDSVISYQQLLDSKLIPRSSLLHSKYHNRLERVQGTYWSMRLDNSLEKININPLKIYSDGKFEIKSSQKVIYHGVLEIFSNFYLCLITLRRGEEPYYAQSIFRVNDILENDINYISGLGVGLSPQGNGTPRCGREILIKLMDEDFDRQQPEFVEIPINGKKSTRYWELDKKYGGVMTFLTGDENNLIKSSLEQKSDFNRDINYGELFFASACYYADKDLDKAKNYIKRAQLHGFKDINRLNDELEKGVLRPLEPFINSFKFIDEYD